MIAELIADYYEKSERADKATVLVQEQMKELREKEVRLERELRKLRTKLDELSAEDRRLWEGANWIDCVVKPLASALAEKTGLQATVNGPSGIASRMFIALTDDPHRSIWQQDRLIINLQPVFDENGFSLVYETGEETDRYAKDTLGAIGGLNRVTAPLPDDLDQILALMERVGPVNYAKLKLETK